MKIKQKTKKRLIKFMRLSVIIFAIFNIAGIILGFSNQSYAGFDVGSIVGNVAYAGIGAAFGGIPFVIVLVIKIFIIVLGMVLQVLISGAFSSFEDGLAWASLKTIIFAGTPGASKFLDVNFFDITANSTDTIDVFRTAIAKWYYILRLISASILLVILIYVGIRMALSTVASEQAKYKQMLVDWVTSLALLFLLHYIIIFIIQVNSTLVQVIKDVDSSTDNNFIDDLLLSVFIPGIDGLFAAAVYLLYVGQVFSFFILYIRRMITVGFLIMIAPLITITYAIDKIGDGKAQALNAWLKELTYNILIQPFHCIIFVAFFGAISDLLKPPLTKIGGFVFIIVLMQFMKKAEDILRKIFHFEASSMSSLKESGQSIANTTGAFVRTGMKAGSAFAGFKAAGGFKAARQNWKQFKLDRKNNSDLKKEFKKQKESGTLGSGIKTFDDYRNSEEGQNAFENIKNTNAQAMKDEANEKRAKKINKNREKYDNKHGEGEYDAMIHNRSKKNYTEEQKAEIDENAREAYDAEHEPGAYDKLKQDAAEKDENGKPTQKAINAQKKLDKVQGKAAVDINKNSQAHNDFINEGGAGIKRSLKNGWQNTGGRAFNNMRKFAQTDYGKSIIASSKDSLKVASAIGLGAFGLGAGDMKDAISLGQVGYGFASGFLQNSTKTVVEDSTEKIVQLAALNGIDPTDTAAMQNLLKGITLDKNTGMLDQKAINSVIEKLEDAIKPLYNQKEGNDRFREIQSDIQASIMEGKLNPAEIERIVKENLGEKFSELDDSDIKEVNGAASNYAEILLKSGIATNGTTLENAGISTDEHDYKVIEKASKTVNNTYNQTNVYENHETNIHNQNSTVNNSTTINNNTGNNSTINNNS